MELLNLFGIYAGTFLFCALSGVVPLMNSELFLLYLGSTANHSQLPALIVLATLGQMSAKVLLYFGGCGVLRLPSGRGREKVEALRLRVSAGRRAAGGVTFVSALTGLPSFYAISVIAGALGWPFSRFVLWGIVGRLLRFSALVFLPGLVKGVM
jgi:membrane protein YqaA with SNARE-associated domain